MKELLYQLITAKCGGKLIGSLLLNLFIYKIISLDSLSDFRYILLKNVSPLSFVTGKKAFVTNSISKTVTLKSGQI